MKSLSAAAPLAAVAIALFGLPATAQVGSVATPRVGTPAPTTAGPPAPFVAPVAGPRTGPLPANLTISQALEEAYARSPTIVAAQADVAAAEGRARQAGFRPNPLLSVEVENFAGTGSLRGIQSLETTLAVNQQLDLGGRRRARMNAAGAELNVQKLRLAIARADLGKAVRDQFAQATAARQRLAQAEESVERARELARIAGILVDAGRDPPLRGLRARSALAQTQADREAAVANDLAARSSLGALIGANAPVGSVSGPTVDGQGQAVVPERSLEVRLAEAERLAAESQVQLQLAERRLDPAVGVGVRHIRETGDVGLVAGVSMPLRVFDRNQGNIDAARQSLLAAEARRANVLTTTTAQVRNAIAAVDAAQLRLKALESSGVPEAEEALRLTNLSYREGRASLLEVIDAQNSYTAARTSLTEARLALALAVAELTRITAQ